MANLPTYARLSQCDISPSLVLMSLQCLQCVSILLSDKYFIMKYNSSRKEALKGLEIHTKVDIFNIQVRAREQHMVGITPNHLSKLLQFGEYAFFQYTSRLSAHDPRLVDVSQTLTSESCRDV